MIFKKNLARLTPKTKIISPTIIEVINDVKTPILILCLSSSPMYLAINTLTPLPIPIRNPVNKVTKMVVEPTAPSAMSPENLPTTAISDMLNNTCKMFDAISGKLNKKIFFQRDPVVKSISLVIIIFLFRTV